MTDHCQFQVALKQSGFFCRNPHVHLDGQLVSEDRCGRCGHRNDDSTVMREVPSRLPKSVPPTPLGPGGHLTAVLAGRPFRIKPSSTCGCHGHAADMNQRGIEWCEANVPQIVAWMKEAAENEKYLFSERGAKLIVRLALMNCRREQKRIAACWPK